MSMKRSASRSARPKKRGLRENFELLAGDLREGMETIVEKQLMDLHRIVSRARKIRGSNPAPGDERERHDCLPSFEEPFVIEPFEVRML